MGVCSKLLRLNTYSVMIFIQKGSVHALSFYMVQLTIILDQSFIIMEMLLRDAKKSRNGSENFHFCRRIAL